MRLIQKGSYGSDVKKWQQFLKRQGYYTDNIDSNFGNKTKAATLKFQKDNGLKDDGIVGKWTIQEAVKHGFQKVKKFVRDIFAIVLHITATGNSTFEAILNGHLNRGWKDIGYHFLILNDGVIYEGRDIDVIGSHVEGHNVGTVAIAFDDRGNDLKADAPYGDYINDKQQASLEKLTAYLIQQYGLTIDKVYGHNDYTKSKACPCFKVRKSKDNVFRDRVNELLKSKVKVKVDIIPRQK